MPWKYPPLTLRDVRRIVAALGFKLDRTVGSHEQWTDDDDSHLVTVDAGYREFSVKLIKKMIRQAGVSRRKFYGATKKTRKKI